MNQRADRYSHHAEPTRPLGEAATYRRGEAICRQGYAADYWYTVVHGVVTRYVIRLDGRRQILDLLLPGDFFGFTQGGDHDATSEAIADDTIVLRFPRRRTEQLIISEAGTANSICAAMMEALRRLEMHLQVMGRVTAPEKVGSFLLEVEQRMSAHRSDIELPISRYDIADYLGISVETVSRALSDLRRRGCIQLTGPRGVRIVDRQALAAGEPDAEDHR